MSFPPTRHTIVQAVQSDDPVVRTRAFDALVLAYWRPAYKYLRLKWGVSAEEAKDLTQEFFARAFEKSFFNRYDRDRSRFRTYLRVCLDGFAANERKSSNRLKRGGGITVVPLDFENAEGELREHQLTTTVDFDEYFHREWVRSMFGIAVERLRTLCASEGKHKHFEAFAGYDLVDEDSERPTYKALAERLGIATTDVTNYLTWARREFRRILTDAVRELSATDEEFEADLRQLLGHAR